MKKRVRCWLLIVGSLLLAIGCGRQADGNAPANTTLGLVDSTAMLMDQVDHYYRQVEHDSLAMLAPVAMDYFRRHSRWQQYYTTWCLQVNDLVWNGQMDRGFEEALNMHRDAMRRHDEFGLSEAYTAMGIAYHFQQNDKEAFNCYEQALQHFPASGVDQSIKLNIYSYYCQVLVDAREYDTMKRVLSQWKEFLDQLTEGHDDMPQHAHKYFRYHREHYKLHYGQGNYRQAALELDLMQHYLSREADREVYEAQVAGFRTQLAMTQRNYAETMAWSDKEIALCRQQDYNTYFNALRHRAEVLQALGHYEEALTAYRYYDRQKDSIIKVDSREQLNELNKRFEIDELKAHQQRAQLEHDRSRLQLLVGMAAIVVVALLVIIVSRHRASRRLRQANQLLEQSNTELQQSYKRLKVANAQAEESSKMKTDFIQQISHEIRTPLNILSGFTQIVTTPGLELEADQLRDINQKITDNTNRITSLVNRMLELAEANSQAVIQCSDEATVAQVAMQAVDDSRISRLHDIDFDLQLCEGSDAVKLTTNLRQAARALSQLLDNARKFTKKGAVRLVSRIGDDSVEYAVEDTGIGVPVYEAERIFGEFVQLDQYYDGTGIGLSVARSIARRMGGDVRLDTTYTSGARFVMTLPRS